MKTRFSIFILFLFISGLGLNVSNQLIAQDTVPCGNAIMNYKKKWLSTNCKAMQDHTCLIRCKGPDIPDISI